MKRNIFFRIVATLLLLSSIIACGGDDEKNSSKKIDGVNTYAGKKIVELTITNKESKYSLPAIVKVEYDKEGRLSRVLDVMIKYDYDEKGNPKYYYSEDYSNIVSIDYYLHTVTFSKYYEYDEYVYSKTFDFTLNNDGYISQLGRCYLKYDSNGYLISMDEPQVISTLTYDAVNDLASASLIDTKKNLSSIIYVTYGNSDTTGDLFVRIRDTDTSKGIIYSCYDFRDVAVFLAYQCGLFGKISKTIVNLNDRGEIPTVFEYTSPKFADEGRVSFVWQ